MRAMILDRPGAALRLGDIELGRPGPREVLIEIEACGVCRTDLHVVDGELPDPVLPIVPGHEAIGRVIELGAGVVQFRVGDRVGVPWLGHTCGACDFCRRGEENLCPAARFTGYHRHGGYAERMIADASFCFAVDPRLDPAEAAPLMCAGLIGYRAYRMGGSAERLGLYGFGAAAHILAQVARQQGRKIFAFTRDGDNPAQELARSLGAVWAGASEEMPPEPLDAAILFAPVGALVPLALQAVRPGGTVVCAGIHMSDIPGFPYRLLWRERVLRSVANLTRRDGEEFFALAKKMRIETQIERHALADANRALQRLRGGEVVGAAVLICH